MAYLTTTGTIIAILTREGRQLLADNSANFKITQFRFSDDEINYAQFDGSTIDAPNKEILQTPILEACTLGEIPSQRYTLLNVPTGTLSIARIDTDIGLPFIDGQQLMRPIRSRAAMILNFNKLPIFGSTLSQGARNNQIQFITRTFYGYDNQYYLRSLTPEIITVQSQAADNIIPCTDPYEIRQKQSQAKLGFSIIVNHNTPVLNNLNIGTPSFQTSVSTLRPTSQQSQITPIIGNEKEIRSLTNTLNYLLKYFSGDNAFASAIKNPSNFTEQIVQKWIQEGWTSIDQFGEIGLAHGIIEITGVNTGKKFIIDAWIYEENVLKALGSIGPIPLTTPGTLTQI